MLHIIQLIVAGMLGLCTNEQPNILWLSVEDMSPWIACYGDSTVATPNIDRLAREGVVYTNAFANSPVCAAARATIITGMYGTSIGSMHHRTGKPSQAAVQRNKDAYAKIPAYEAIPPAEVRCFPELLRRAGFYTTNNSKTDCQFKLPVTVWDVSSRKAHWRNRAKDQRFFSVFNNTRTHESGTFPNARRSPRVVDPASVNVPPYYPDTPLVRADIARTYDNIAEMDKWVGSKLKELSDDGLLENTIVVFFGDHGVGLPRGKRAIYDSGTRVPLIVRWPDGHDAGTTNDSTVSFVDFAPTVLSMAGVAIPEHLHGRAFAGASSKESTGRVYINADRHDSETDCTRSVTDGRFRYVLNLRPELPRLYPVAYAESIPMMADIHALQESGNATEAQWQIVSKTKPREEFYDNADDPHEVVNVINDPSHAERIETMRNELAAWMTMTNDMGLMPEADMVRERLWPPEGEKPKTAAPKVVRNAAGEVEISCATDGASIGYRFGKKGSWRVYVEPFAASDEQFELLQVRAHRIGYIPASR